MRHMQDTRVRKCRGTAAYLDLGDEGARVVNPLGRERVERHWVRRVLLRFAGCRVSSVPGAVGRAETSEMRLVLQTASATVAPHRACASDRVAGKRCQDAPRLPWMGGRKGLDAAQPIPRWAHATGTSSQNSVSTAPRCGEDRVSAIERSVPVSATVGWCSRRPSGGAPNVVVASRRPRLTRGQR
jgi:hypothetical protein